MLVGLMAFTYPLLPLSTASTPKPYRVVFHVNSGNPKVQAGALRNARNFLRKVGAKHADLRILLHSGGVKMVLLPKAAKRTRFKTGLATGKQKDMITFLRKQGVRFLVCNNTMKSKHITREKDLFNVPKKDVVPSGVVALVELQRQGFAYVKP